jgi:hypothetical protein
MGIKPESRSRLLEDKFQFASDEQVLVNALDLCDEVFSHDKLKRLYNNAMSRIDMLETVIAIKDCEHSYRVFDIKA